MKSPTPTSTPALPLQPGALYRDFRVRAVTPLAALRLTAVELEHAPTGARLMHLQSDDMENLFSVTFPTPPSDHTGVPHILEHAVLSGSRRFPVRDPFFEMLKISMATFINAMTAQDHTLYPVASNVKQDLFNLAEVYFDAVFHPLLEEDTFKREGHHLLPADPARPTGDLTVNGIVYNEMKAAFSRPESRLYFTLPRRLLPDGAGAWNSGGDPEHIPDLTYEGLKRFHAAHYQPSNAYFVFYGNIPTTDYLDFLQPRLAAFTRAPAAATGPRPTRWTAPRTAEECYPVGPADPLTERTFHELAWYVGDALDLERGALLDLLGTILLGNDASPLKKAIIDSRLGQDLLHGGYTDLGREAVFAVGLRGSEPERAGAFRDLVLTTLERLAARRFDAELVEAAFHNFAYHCLEIPAMYPLHVMNLVLSGWIYGAEPLQFLRQGELLAACRRRYESDPDVFNRLLREALLANPHRLDVVMRPDRDWEGRTAAAFAARMQGARAGRDEAELRRLASEAEALQRKAGTPNPPEAVAKLPQLHVRDLPRRPVHIPTAAEELPSGAVLLRNDVFANGVSYLHLDFSLRGLPAPLWPVLPRYQETLCKLGAAGLDYERMARRVAAHTGGIGTSPAFAVRTTGAAGPAWGLRLSLKTLDAQIAPALDILRDLLFDPDPRDRKRFAEVLVQTVAGTRTALVNGGPSTAVRHLARGLSPEGYLQELTGGLSQLRRVERLSAGFEAEADALMNQVLEIAAFLRNPRRITASFTGGAGAAARVRDALAAWTARMTPAPVTEAPTGFQPFDGVPRFGLAGPMQVAHCVQMVPAVPPGHPDIPLLLLGLGLLRMDYFISELRFKGNAYGANCGYDGTGFLVLSTYADPHIHRTLDVFAGLADYVRAARWSQTEIDRGIINTAKYALAPIRPREATAAALGRHLVGETAAFREAQYARLLAATPAEVQRALLSCLDGALTKSPVCVVSSRERLEQANAERPGQALQIESILEETPQS